MDAEDRCTLEDIIAQRAGPTWRKVLKLLRALGAKEWTGKHGRTRIWLCGVKHVLHTSHPDQPLSDATLADIRRFIIEVLIACGVIEEKI